MIELPSWLNPEDYEGKKMTHEEAMSLAVQLSMKNIENNSGGPFGAVILSPVDNTVISVGVNLVVTLGSSMYHAEIVAILRAQKNRQLFRINEGILFTSSQPCCMCYGSLFWSGIDQLVIGARKEDVETYTEFKEGPLPSDWQLELKVRDIKVKTDFLRDDAIEALKQYSNVHY
eukprot:NODE_79_length_23048_cov_0.747614.p13 type:complete len:174 gc:universal NODE_79_length_23048_cov_0.747614:4431-4952(+)